MWVLPPSQRRARLFRGRYPSFLALTDSCADPVTSPRLWPQPGSRSLCRLLSAPAANRTFSTLFCVSFLGCLVPCHGGPIGCTSLLTSPMSSAFPLERTGWLPASFHERDFSWASFRDCRHFFMFRPPSLLASQIAPTAMAMPLGGRGFYIRAERASLPPHAPDMLAVRCELKVVEVIV
jgi:hypothetical protein